MLLIHSMGKIDKKIIVRHVIEKNKRKLREIHSGIGNCTVIAT
jgi:hypothetical protein